MFKARSRRAAGALKPVDVMILLGAAINAAIIGAIVILCALKAL